MAVQSSELRARGLLTTPTPHILGAAMAAEGAGPSPTGAVQGQQVSPHMALQRLGCEALMGR